MDTVWRRARKLALVSLTQKDGLPDAVLPEKCPFCLTQIEDGDWFPAGPAGGPG